MQHLEDMGKDMKLLRMTKTNFMAEGELLCRMDIATKDGGRHVVEYTKGNEDAAAAILMDGIKEDDLIVLPQLDDHIGYR